MRTRWPCCRSGETRRARKALRRVRLCRPTSGRRRRVGAAGVERAGERCDLPCGFEAERVRAEKVEVHRDKAVSVGRVEDEVNAGVFVLVERLALAELVVRPLAA